MKRGHVRWVEQQVREHDHEGTPIPFIVPEGNFLDLNYGLLKECWGNSKPPSVMKKLKDSSELSVAILDANEVQSRSLRIPAGAAVLRATLFCAQEGTIEAEIDLKGLTVNITAKIMGPKGTPLVKDCVHCVGSVASDSDSSAAEYY